MASINNIVKTILDFFNTDKDIKEILPHQQLNAPPIQGAVVDPNKKGDNNNEAKPNFYFKKSDDNSATGKYIPKATIDKYAKDLTNPTGIQGLLPIGQQANFAKFYKKENGELTWEPVSNNGDIAFSYLRSEVDLRFGR